MISMNGVRDFILYLIAVVVGSVVFDLMINYLLVAKALMYFIGVMAVYGVWSTLKLLIGKQKSKEVYNKLIFGREQK